MWCVKCVFVLWCVCIGVVYFSDDVENIAFFVVVGEIEW